MNWNDFNDEYERKEFAIIPKGTIAKVKMYIKAGGYDNPDLGLTDELATQNPETGAVYLKVDFQILEGEYAGRHIFGRIGLHSPKSDTWARMGREFIKGVLSSARGVSTRDNSARAIAARKIESLSDLDGIGFLARIDVEVDSRGKERNIIRYPITCDHKDYESLIRGKNAPAFIETATNKREDFYWAG